MQFTKFLFYLLLVSIPFGTRTLIHQFTTGFHEYETVFLYANDLVLLLFLFSYYFPILRVVGSNFQFPISNFQTNFKFQIPKALIVFLLLAAISIFFAFSMGLAIYNFARLLLLVLAAFATAGILKSGIVKLEGVFTVLAGSAVFQSLMGIAQFIKQGSLGLAFLGEPFLSAEGAGIAKIVVEGARVLRAYGTFPHPNVLAAFLILGLLSLYYLWLRHNTGTQKIRGICANLCISVSLFVVLLGLLLTFSRTAWLVAALATLVIVILSRSWRLAVLSFATVLIIFAFLSPYVLSRAKVSSQEPSVNYRLIYNQIGLDLIKNNLFGVGIGNQVLHSVKNGIYQKFGLDQAWQWQPVHNIYLLIGAEMGVLGLLAFMAFLGRLLISNKILNSKNVIVIVMLSSLLALGLVDHFLWTLQPGRLMLWLVIGILLAYQAPVVKRT